jgi:preprotein translocase subunit SecY
MLSAFTNIFRIPELKSRLLFTLAMIIVIRAGAHIPLPGVDATLLEHVFKGSQGAGGGVTALLNVFSGGALTQCAIFSLGIMPYISASIMMQLMAAVFPRLAKLRKEDGGYQKISQYTRYIALGLCVVQGYLLAVSLENPASNPLLQGLVQNLPPGQELVPGEGWMFRIMTVITVTAGTMLLMWIGDQVTERGVGNGTSMIIAVNILSSLPQALVAAWKQYVVTDAGSAAGNVSRVMIPVILVTFLVLVIAAVIAITQAVRKIAIHYAKRVVGRKMIGGQSTFLPLKVNYAGVMPIIFAQALVVFPTMILGFAFPNNQVVHSIVEGLNNGVWHYLFYAFMIFFFSYFWVATQFQPTQIAEDLKKHNGYVPGIRPGKPTAEFLDYTMTRLTFAGAIFLTMVAVLPQMLSTSMKVPSWTAQFFGGTSLLIIVGVLLDTMRQVETHLIQRHYDGFLRKGKLRGRNQAAPAVRRGGSSSKVLSDRTLVYMYLGISVLIILFVVAVSMRD